MNQRSSVRNTARLVPAVGLVRAARAAIALAAGTALLVGCAINSPEENSLRKITVGLSCAENSHLADRLVAVTDGSYAAAGFTEVSFLDESSIVSATEETPAAQLYNDMVDATALGRTQVLITTLEKVGEQSTLHGVPMMIIGILPSDEQGVQQELCAPVPPAVDEESDTAEAATAEGEQDPAEPVEETEPIWVYAAPLYTIDSYWNELVGFLAVELELAERSYPEVEIVQESADPENTSAPLPLRTRLGFSDEEAAWLEAEMAKLGYPVPAEYFAFPQLLEEAVAYQERIPFPAQ